MPRKTFDRIRKVMHLPTRVSAVIEPGVWHPENCGMRFTRDRPISPVARAPGWSTMPLDTALACASGTAVTEGAANFLVNRRMNKSQQCAGLGEALTWCCKSAAHLPVYNGTLGFGFGQRFEPIGRPDAAVAIAA